MPIYIKYPEIKGNVTNAGNGGVWKTTNFLVGGTANRRGGIHVALGDLDSAATSNTVEISRISFPNAPSGFNFVDGRDANAIIKAGMMFQTQRSGGTFTLTFQGQTTRSGNNLRQIALSGRRISRVKIFVVSAGNSSHLEIELENCLISSYSNGADASASLSVNFTKITFNTPPIKS